MQSSKESVLIQEITTLKSQLFHGSNSKVEHIKVKNQDEEVEAQRREIEYLREELQKERTKSRGLQDLIDELEEANSKSSVKLGGNNNAGTSSSTP